MNKKIYFNNKFILITEGSYQPSEYQLIVQCDSGNDAIVTETLKKFIQQNDQNNLILLTKNVLATFELIKKEFSHIVAAGGLIKNKGKYLFIYRLNKWDLPKGKMDKGETIPQTAVRECEEECGVKGLRILNELAPSYHIYAYKGSYALKTTHWFLMETDDDTPLVPQANENIVKAEWLSPEDIRNLVLPNTYPGILDMISLNIN